MFFDLFDPVLDQLFVVITFSVFDRLDVELSYRYSAKDLLSPTMRFNFRSPETKIFIEFPHTS